MAAKSFKDFHTGKSFGLNGGGWVDFLGKRFYVPNTLIVANSTTTTAPLGSFAFPDYVGVKQKITATVVGTITTAGNVAVIITAVGMTGSPITLSVAVALNDTAAQVATKIRTALTANANVLAFFTIGGSGAAITLTSKTAAANDVTMNLDINNDTSVGLTDAPTAAQTTAGVAPQKNKIFVSDGAKWQAYA